ncbi:MAG: hypothetical protein FWF84_07910 [Kiritimatiellaeota bacterium]|nr:hypothetical protein [Kiritimatiellota bacterium]
MSAQQMRPAELYNEAVEAYRADDYAAAATQFEGLKARFPSATEAWAAALYHQVTETDAPSPEAIALREKTAAAFQEALRLRPDDLRRRDNLNVVAAPLPRLREERRHEEILKKYADQSPDQLLAKLLAEQRLAYAQAHQALTNATPSQIAQFEAAAKTQKEAEDIWMPLGNALLGAAQQSVTDPDDLAAFQDQILSARHRAKLAADRLRDIDPAGIDALHEAEGATLGFFAMLAPPPLLIDEAIAAQSNTLHAAADAIRSPLEDQSLAAFLTTRFHDTLDGWLGQEGVSGEGLGGSEASPPLSDEDRQRIEELTLETMEIHSNLLATASLREAYCQKALDNLIEIRDLLPKDQNQQQQEQQQQNSEPRTQNPEEQNQEQKPDEQDSQEDDSQESDPQEQDAQEQDTQEQDAADEDAAEEGLDPALQEIMARILQQEKDRADEKQRRLRNLPPLPYERDW